MKLRKVIMSIIVLYTMLLSVNAFAALSTDASEKYFGRKVTNAEEATIIAYDYLSNLAGYEEVQLWYSETKVSTVTDCNYYVFRQVQYTEYEGEKLPARFLPGILKVIADSEGNFVNISYSLKPVNGEQIPVAYSLSEEERQNEYVFYSKELINKQALKKLPQGAVFYEDKTVYGYTIAYTAVDDGAENSMEVYPVWFTYYSLQDDKGEAQYYAKLYHTTSEPGKYVYIDVLRLPSKSLLGVADCEAIAEGYFDSRYYEEAGTVTYQIDYSLLGIAKEAELGGVQTVTVPIMKEKESGLYILGSIKNRVMVTNCNVNNSSVGGINRVVSENPSDIESWHFERTKDVYTGQTYIFDPNYAIANYNSMCEVVKGASHIFELGVENQATRPVLLNLYDYYGVELGPNNEQWGSLSSFCFRFGWNHVNTGPTDNSGLGLALAAHEYFHEIAEDTGYQKKYSENEAIDEGISDTLGMLLELITRGHADDRMWGQYSSVTGDDSNRRLSDPYFGHEPKYIGDKYYMNFLTSELRSRSCDTQFFVNIDRGGIHANSRVISYLAYQLSNKEATGENETALTARDNAKLWYELTYMKSYGETFTDIGQYLGLSAELIGLSQSKKNYLKRLIFDHGLEGTEESRIRVEELIKEGGAKEVSIHFSFDDEAAFEDRSVGLIAEREGLSSAFAVFSEEPDIFAKMDINSHEKPYLYLIENKTGALEMMGGFFDAIDAPASTDYYLEVISPKVSKGDSMTFENTMLNVRYITDLNLFDQVIVSGNTVTFDKEGYYNIVVHTEDMKPNEIRIYIVEVK